MNQLVHMDSTKLQLSSGEWSCFCRWQVLPVERGAGLDQAGMRAAEARLAAGDWVHVFPEGTRSRDGRVGHARKGVGRLVAACKQTPLGVYHHPSPTCKS